MSKRVKITKGDQEALCMPEALPAWERNGWTRADDGSSEESSSEEPEPKKKTTRKAAQ